VSIGPDRAAALGVTLFESADAGPTPLPFLAETVQPYAIPFVRPVTVIGLPVPVCVTPPGLQLTVYPVIGEPPLEAGAVKLTVACPSPPRALTPAGAPGTELPPPGAVGATPLDGADGAPIPVLLLARTVHVYAVPFVRPVTVSGLAAPVFVTAPGSQLTV
jgi:hypothetical protein